jgi:hypothetical protein
MSFPGKNFQLVYKIDIIAREGAKDYHFSGDPYITDFKGWFFSSPTRRRNLKGTDAPAFSVASLTTKKETL